jgi:TPR repeat protein
MNNLACLLLSDSKLLQSSFENPIELLTRAEQAGSARASANLGLAYERGWQVAINKNSAASYYRKASELGDGLGKLRLSQLILASSGSTYEEHV